MGVTTMGSRLASGQQPSSEVKHLAPHLVEAEQTGVISVGTAVPIEWGREGAALTPSPESRPRDAPPSRVG